jgi:hypothetical protein
LTWPAMTDTREPPLGLATGRLGVGILFDRAGNDVYALCLGSGGTGFGGLGILFGAEGDDIYTGERMTEGAAIGGLGLLIDGSGHDRYSSHEFALGFGGPLGVGVVIDVRGNDHYQCGGAIPSAYNLQDAPRGDPRDPPLSIRLFWAWGRSRLPRPGQTTRRAGQKSGRRSGDVD